MFHGQLGCKSKDPEPFTLTNFAWVDDKLTAQIWVGIVRLHLERGEREREGGREGEREEERGANARSVHARLDTPPDASLLSFPDSPTRLPDGTSLHPPKTLSLGAFPLMPPTRLHPGTSTQQVCMC